MRTLWLSALLLCGCGDDTTTSDDTGTGGTTADDTGTTGGTTDTEPEPVDLDQDGVLSDRDCDDEDPNNFPGNVEVCDGQDNDCDTVVDDDPYDVTTWYLDADQDGYGTPDATLDTCELPDGYSANDEDCDDLDPATYPTAPEDCDGVDQDCDDYVDEDVAGEEATWYADGDGDGYGTPYYTESACTQPSGHVDNAEDCDDQDIAIYPGGTEVCDDADNDCDGAADEGSPVGASTWYIDYDSDGYGSTSFTQDACEAPTGYVDNTSDCDDTDRDVHPGATEACNELDDDCDTTVDEDAEFDLDTYFDDDDGDGYGDASDTTEACSQPSGHVTNDDDCDDSAADTYPSADETCDDADQDCDGDVDEDATDGDTWWIDLDGDGYGNLILTTSDCDQPTGYVDNDDDCDDLEADAWPGNTEVCDGIDNDCDDDADEAGSSDAPTWYLDDDGDGYGDADTSAVQCETPSDYGTDSSDCDDSDPTISPSALEQCDAADNDCDGTVDEDDAIDVVTWYADDDGDGYGDADVSEEHCDAPTDFVADATDCDDAESLANPGESETCNDGIDNDCDGTAGGCQISGSFAVSKAEAEWYGEAGDEYLGCDVAFAGDMDADGYDDMIFGAFYNDDHSSRSGAAYLVAGGASVSGTSAVSSGVQLYGENSYDYAGYSVAGGFDVNDDGYDDVLIAAIYSDGYTTDSGSIYLLYGPPPTGDTYLYDADAEYYGESSSQYMGHGLALVGDIDADGYADVMFGGYGNDDGGTQSGSAYLFYGPPSSYDQYGYNADAQFTGEDSYDYAGDEIAYAGDLNDDGFDDILIGAPTEDSGGEDAGAVYVLFGDVSGDTDLGSADAKYTGEYDYDNAGWSLSAGDLTGDGQRDIAIGAYSSDEGGNDSGIVYIINANQTGTVDLGSADATLVGERSSTYAGADVSVADLNADGFDDITIGAFGVSSSSGATYIVYGPVTGTVDLATADAEIRGNGTSDYLGYAVAAGGDVDGDGVGDLIAGAQYADDNGGNSGTVYLFYGTGI